MNGYENCSFVGNSATSTNVGRDKGGGGIGNDFYSHPVIIGCTFRANSGVPKGGAVLGSSGSLSLVNCILWDDTANLGPEIALVNGCPLSIGYSDLEGWLSGTGIFDESGSSVIDGGGMIDADPLFADGDGRLAWNSPCVEVGDNGYVASSADRDGNPRIVDGDVDGIANVDMGAYEYQRSDSDLDGIEDVIDTAPSIYSADFADAATPATHGTIMTRGDQTLALTDVPDVGIQVRTAPVGGPAFAEVSFCDGRFVLTLGPSTLEVRGCNSEIEVFDGTVTITYLADDGTVAVITLPENNSLEFSSDTFGVTAPSDNVDVVVVEVDGEVFTLDPGAGESPVVGAITGPTEPVQVNTDVEMSADFGDPDELGGHTATWGWGDTQSSSGTVGLGTAIGSHAYAEPGVYTVTLTVTDKAGNAGVAMFEYVVVYDSSAGFVTGGGWIDSPEGAYVPDPSLTGKASFGFVSKYKKGANAPTGNTEFQFKAADLNFHSSSYDWLVVTGSDYARFKGTGTINGSGEYKFMIWAGDDAPDTFRIKIWEEDDAGTETVIYDNRSNQAIGGGSIVVHAK